MNDTIDGIHATIIGTELRELCLAQSAFHDKRCKFYKGELEKMKSLQLTPEKIELPKYSNYVDPTEQVRDKIKHHGKSARQMKFLADHIDVGKNYLLSTGELDSLGVGHAQ